MTPEATAYNPYGGVSSGTYRSGATNMVDTARAQNLGSYQGNLYGDARNAQEQALAMYLAQAEGKNSIVQEQLRQGMQSNLANTIQGTAMQRGGNLAAMSGAAAGAGAAQGAQMNNAAALARLQEQQAAMQGYSGLASTMAGQNLQQQMGFEGLGAQQGMFNAGAANQQSQFSRQMKLQEQQAQFQNAMQGVQMASSLAGGLLMSDERRKTDVAPAGPELGDALMLIQPSRYQYDAAMQDPGQKFGVMAQDVERSPLGQQVVVNTPAGKMLDSGQTAAVALAGTSDHERRLRAIEAARTADPFAGDPRTYQAPTSVVRVVPRSDPFDGVQTRPVAISDNQGALLIRRQTPDAESMAPVYDPRKAAAERNLSGGLITRRYG